MQQKVKKVKGCEYFLNALYTMFPKTAVDSTVCEGVLYRSLYFIKTFTRKILYVTHGITFRLK